MDELMMLSCLLQEPFSVRDDIPDLSDDDITAAKIPEPMKPTVLSFKSKNDSDLFGLGIEERSIKSKESSEEQDGKSQRNILLILTIIWIID